MVDGVQGQFAVRLLAKLTAQRHGATRDAEARELERLAMSFVAEGMSAWEAVRQAEVLVFKMFAQAKPGALRRG